MPNNTSGIVWTGVNPGKINNSFIGRRFTGAFNACVLDPTGSTIINRADGPTSTANAACPASATPETAAWRKTANSFYLTNIPPNFSTVRFAAPPYGNATVFKAFQVTERVKFELRVLAENIANTPYFTAVSNGNTPTSTTFGQMPATESNDPRSLQFTARVSF